MPTRHVKRYFPKRRENQTSWLDRLSTRSFHRNEWLLERRAVRCFEVLILLKTWQSIWDLLLHSAENNFYMVRKLYGNYLFKWFVKLHCSISEWCNGDSRHLDDWTILKWWGYTLNYGETYLYLGIPGGSDGKASACNAGFDSWVGKIPWRRKRQSTPALLPGKSQGWRSLIGYCPWGREELDMTERN